MTGQFHLARNPIDPHIRAAGDAGGHGNPATGACGAIPLHAAQTDALIVWIHAA
jgi:hypothetical protein